MTVRRSIARWKTAILSFVKMNPRTDLAKVRSTLHSPRCFARSLSRRNEEGHLLSALSLQRLKLLQCMIVADWRALAGDRGADHLGDVKSAARIEPDVVRREEVAGIARPLAAAEARQNLASRAKDAHPAPRGIW